MKNVIKKIEKVLDNAGRHAVVNTDHGKFYRFKITFENGDIGYVLGKSGEYSIKEGSTVTYDAEPLKDIPNTYRISKVKMVREEEPVKQNGYNNRLAIMLSNYSMSLTLAIKLMKATGRDMDSLDTIMKVADKIRPMIETVQSRDQQLFIYHCIEDVIAILESVGEEKLKQMADEKVSVIAAVIKLSNRIINDVMQKIDPDDLSQSI